MTSVPAEDDPLRPRDPSERGQLYSFEIFWRKNYEFLQSKGYELRPRFKPDWVPSWTGQKYSSTQFEDAQTFNPMSLIDATRRSDGTYVVLKACATGGHSEELEMSTMFGTGSLATDPRNHCPPLYDTFMAQNSHENTVPYRIFVFPLLRPFDDPRFFTIGEAVECIRQIFEGLQFMHLNHVAHRDLNANNIMMDPCMFLDDYHPARRDWRRDYTGPARHVPRLKRPPRYYLIDLGLSRRYDPAHGPALDLPVQGGDFTLPELRAYDTRCDPFASDIYTLGNWIKERFIDLSHGFDFLQPLVADMTQEDPARRPKIGEAVARLDGAVKRAGAWHLRARVHRKDRPLPRDIAHFVQRVVWTLTRTPALPVPPPAKAKATAQDHVDADAASPPSADAASSTAPGALSATPIPSAVTTAAIPSSLVHTAVPAPMDASPSVPEDAPSATTAAMDGLAPEDGDTSSSTPLGAGNSARPVTSEAQGGLSST